MMRFENNENAEETANEKTDKGGTARFETDASKSTMQAFLIAPTVAKV